MTLRSAENQHTRMRKIASAFGRSDNDSRTGIVSGSDDIAPLCILAYVAEMIASSAGDNISEWMERTTRQ